MGLEGSSSKMASSLNCLVPVGAVGSWKLLCGLPSMMASGWLWAVRASFPVIKVKAAWSSLLTWS